MDDTVNSSAQIINTDMENMDVALNYDSPDLMSSEFFDSVLSLENNLDDGFFPNFEEDINLSSDTSHTDEVLSPGSFYSESDKNSSYSTENNDEATSVLESIDEFDDSILMSFLEPVQSTRNKSDTEEPVVKSSILQNQKPTQILIQNPSNKKFIAKPLLNTAQYKKNLSKPKTQILNIQQVASNGRPVLLPLSVKSIKILNTTADVAALTGSVKRRKFDTVHTVLSTSSEDDDSNVVSSSNQYPLLSLTNEEKRLLAKEGIQLPSHHPLTKNEERELKRIRRKIRNKISAQDSRKRKKEYVDGLEERVKRGSEENKNLLQRVKELQRQNRTLIAHVNKLQALICNSTSSKATPSTCLMVVLLSALLVSLPNMRLFENKQISNEQEHQVSIRRSLLSSPQTTEEDLNMEEFLIFKDEELEFESKFSEIIDSENSTEKEFSKMLGEVGKKYDSLMSETKHTENIGVIEKLVDSIKIFLKKEKPTKFEKPPEFEGFHNKRGFIEPDIDDYLPTLDEGPPLKRIKRIGEELDVIENRSVISTTLTTSGLDTKEK